MEEKKWSIKVDCKAFLQGEKSKEQFVVTYSSKLLTLDIDTTSKEDASRFLRDCLQADIREYCKAFSTDVKAVQVGTFEQQNWLKYYERRRKTEIPAIIDTVYGKNPPVFDLEKIVKQFLATLDKNDQRGKGLEILKAMTEV